ncbi:MAG: hypothetical protein JXR10_07980 [Cyclobacteriaceae bacterium]
MKIIGYFLFLFLVIGTMQLVKVVTHSISPSTLSEAAVQPDLLLSNSKQYFKEHAKSRGLFQLEKAIDAIIEIEQDLDDESREKVEEAVSNLRELVEEMKHHNFDIDDLNSAFDRTLNALTYAELKVTEHFLETHQSTKAMLALKYGMVHIKNSLMYSTGKKKEYEINIYDEMDSLLESGQLDNKEIIQKLELMIEDLDNLEESPDSH